MRVAGFPAGARRCLVLLVALATAGCEVTHPDWAWFNEEHHPVGAIPAQTGFYFGAYVVAPPVYVLAFPFIILGDIFTAPVAMMGREGQRTYEKQLEDQDPVRVSERIGKFFGVILGAPFHLVALPFGRRGGDAEPGVLEEPAPGGDPRYDEEPPAIPRDYPWPPKSVP